ncbi:InlB B-repeat-containing protein, partial [Herbiconiux daphne]
QVQSGEEIKYRFDIDSSHRIPVKGDPAEYVLQFTDNDNYVHNVKNFTTAGTTYYENTTTVPSSKNGVIHFELNAVPVAPPVVKRTLNFYQNGATATANGQSLAQPKQFDDGTEVDIVVTPASGYQFKTITTKKGTVVTPITITDIKAPVSFKLTMDADTDITVQEEQIPVAPAVKHNLTVNHDANSNVTASGTTVTNGAILPYDENTAVPIVVSPKTGYEITKIEYIKGGTTTTVPISNSQGANSFSIVLDGDCTLNVTSALHVEMIDIKLDNQSGNLKITLNGTEYTTTTTVKVPENTVLNFKVEVVKPHLHF